MKPLFRIALCELFHPFIFGKDENSDKNIDGHFLVINSYTRNHFINNDEEEEEVDISIFVGSTIVTGVGAAIVGSNDSVSTGGPC